MKRQLKRLRYRELDWPLVMENPKKHAKYTSTQTKIIQNRSVSRLQAHVFYLKPLIPTQPIYTTTKSSFYIGRKQVSTSGPTPSLFQMSLYVDNNDIGHPRTRLCNVRIQRQCVFTIDVI